MEDNKFQKFMHTIKDKFKRNSKVYPSMNEYAFSKEEMDELQKENKQKIQELKKETIEPKEKEEVLNETELNDSILNEENQEELEVVEETKLEEPSQMSYIHLEEEHQKLIMQKWEEIDLNEIEDDITIAKDLLNHNYTITYTEDAARLIHEIRKKYETVLCYLIGFNNEKKGIYEKTYFSDNLDNEWQYLNYYIKLLEKIKGFKVNK